MLRDGDLRGGGLDILCAAMLHASPLSGMTLMYLLMSVFYSSAWLKLIGAAREAKSNLC
jgi:hypothetical protein